MGKEFLTPPPEKSQKYRGFNNTGLGPLVNLAVVVVVFLIGISSLPISSLLCFSLGT